MSDDRYLMTISLNVLNHLGLNLYSNTPAVIAEVIANAWDADATKMDVDFDIQGGTITVTDNGCGMDLAAVNNRYLHVGYQKRKDQGAAKTDRSPRRSDVGYQKRKGQGTEVLTPKGRKPMGRKGIGKLSLFSIANKIYVHTKSEEAAAESFLMDAEKIRKAIEGEDPSKPKQYRPQVIAPKGEINTHGTKIVITDLKKFRLTQGSMVGLRKRIARRFSILDDVEIRVNGERVTFSDRDYFHKARFLYQYGDDYARLCKNLDRDADTNELLCFERGYRFDQSGSATESGQYEVKGWIAIARHSNDLDDSSQQDNLNKITIVVRGKIAQEDILQEFRLGGMITKYIFGEIHADFLDDDAEDDIATSSRQSISVDDPRYKALKSFIEAELKHVWNETNRLKEKQGLTSALESNPYLKEWYEALKPRPLQKFAAKIFGDIDKAGIDEARKQDFYANGVLAFKAMETRNAFELLENVDESNLDVFLEYLSDVDAIEAAHYREIVRERLQVVERLQSQVKDDAKERVIQEYVFEHLWLLDPAWERATRHEEMEKRLQEAIDGKSKTLRADISYQRVSAAHVIIELKRGSRSVSKSEIESQLVKYINALKKELAKNPIQNRLPIEAVCIVGKLPPGWENAETRKQDEDSLRPYDIRVLTYDELIDNARSAYSKFLDAQGNTRDLEQLIKNIRNYKPASATQ